MTVNSSSETFNQDANSLTNLGTFNLTRATFNFNGGTVTGNPPIINAGTLNNSSGGSGTFILRGSGAYSGDTAAVSS